MEWKGREKVTGRGRRKWGWENKERILTFETLMNLENIALHEYCHTQGDKLKSLQDLAPGH